jgi:acetyltransferase-like isoleucine patch superfamily enzyme
LKEDLPITRKRYLLRRSLERLISRIKGREYSFDPEIPLGPLVSVALRRLLWLVRGNLKSMLLRQRLCGVFVAPGVTWRNARMIRFGHGITLERGVIVDGLSRQGVEIGDDVVIGPYSVIRASMLTRLGEGVRIGKRSAMDAYSYIGAGGGVFIGDCVIMGQHVSFHAENHQYDRLDVPIREQGITRKGIVIEDDCWVGSNVTFLDGVRVGRGCVIAAGTIVRGEIPAYSVVAGVPGRVIKTRKEEAITPVSVAPSLVSGR